MRGGWFFNFDSLYSYLIDSDRVQNTVCQISNQVEADSHLQPSDWISGFNPENQNGAQMSFSRCSMVSFTLPVTAFSNIKSWFDPISAPPNLSPLRNRTYAFPSSPGPAFNCHNCRHTAVAFICCVAIAVVTEVGSSTSTTSCVMIIELTQVPTSDILIHATLSNVTLYHSKESRLLTWGRPFIRQLSDSL